MDARQEPEKGAASATGDDGPACKSTLAQAVITLELQLLVANDMKRALQLLSHGFSRARPASTN